MPNSFFSRSARKGPTPFKYSMGWDSMEAKRVIETVYDKYTPHPNPLQQSWRGKLKG